MIKIHRVRHESNLPRMYQVAAYDTAHAVLDNSFKRTEKKNAVLGQKTNSFLTPPFFTLVPNTQKPRPASHRPQCNATLPSPREPEHMPSFSVIAETISGHF